jgi:hypothetical protein
MKYKYILALLLLIALLPLFFRTHCNPTNTEIILVQEIMLPQQQQQPPAYFGPASHPFGIPYGNPTRPLRELGGWRVNYGTI